MIKKTDASILQEIAEDAVKSSGIGIYRQKKKTSQEDESGNESLSGEVVTESPEQLRDKFAESLKVLEHDTYWSDFVTQHLSV